MIPLCTLMRHQQNRIIHRGILMRGTDLFDSIAPSIDL